MLIWDIAEPGRQLYADEHTLAAKFDLVVMLRTRGAVAACAWGASGTWLAAGGPFGVTVLDLCRVGGRRRELLAPGQD